MTARIVVTGGAGFLGSHLCASLLLGGNEVVCVDNLATGSASNLSGLSKKAGFTVVRHDVSSGLPVEGAVDAVLHFASPASPVDYLKMPIRTLEVGSLGTQHALMLAHAKKARFLLASTSEVYGEPRVHPQREGYRGSVDPVGPRGVYNETKRFAEAMTMAYHRHHGVNTAIARIFNTYGPRMRPDDGRVVPNFITAALGNQPLTVFGDGEQTRSFCYVDDMVRGLLALLDSTVHQPVNIGNPKEITINRLADVVLSVTGSSSSLRYRKLPSDDPTRRCPDIGRAEALLGWTPEVPLAQGLKHTAEWFHTHA